MQASDDAPGAGMGAPARLSVEALRVIEGEAKAREYIVRLQGLQADPDELALIVCTLYGAALYGFARVIEKAIRGVLP